METHGNPWKSSHFLIYFCGGGRNFLRFMYFTGGNRRGKFLHETKEVVAKRNETKKRLAKLYSKIVGMRKCNQKHEEQNNNHTAPRPQPVNDNRPSTKNKNPCICVSHLGGGTHGVASLHDLTVTGVNSEVKFRGVSRDQSLISSYNSYVHISVSDQSNSNNLRFYFLKRGSRD